jgi:hypothetical protein
MPVTYIIIINWNGASDTIACLDSIMTLQDTRIVLLDNASSDNSVTEIEKYLKNKSVLYASLNLSDTHIISSIDHKILFLKSQVNLGFAKGNNAMLGLIQQEGIAPHAWLLNNDTVVQEQTLSAMLRKINEDKQTAFVGSVTLDYSQPTLIQCCGVHYYKYCGVGKLIMKNEEWNEEAKQRIPTERIDFQNGASLLVRMSALKEIGFMDERFFLYSEEHDWQETAKKLGYNNVLATDSVLHHKGSVATENKKFLFYYYYSRSSVLFSRKHFNIFVSLSATCMLIGITIVRTRLNPKNMFWAMKGILEGWFKA